MSAKSKKKRNKRYSGVDASLDKPIITKVSAVNRTKLGQWWFDRKKVLKPIIITIGVVILVIWLILELVRIASS